MPQNPSLALETDVQSSVGGSNITEGTDRGLGDTVGLSSHMQIFVKTQPRATVALNVDSAASVHHGAQEGLKCRGILNTYSAEEAKTQIGREG